MAEDRKSMPKTHCGVLSEAMASANRCRGIVRTSNFLRLDIYVVHLLFVQPRGIVSFRSPLRLVVVSVLLPLILSTKSPIRMVEPRESYPA